MNKICFLLILFATNFSFGQDWELVKTDTTLEFSYEYWFRFQNLNDSSAVELATKEKDTSKFNLKGNITNNKGEKIAFIKIIISAKTDGKIIKSYSNADGEFQIDLPPGEYNFRTVSSRHDRLEFDFKIESNEQVFLNIKLGLTEELVTYQINSKEKLTEEKIEEIMNCVKINRDDVYRNCSENGKFYLSIHI